MINPTIDRVPTELMMAFAIVLDVVPPCLEDWIRTTGFGEINLRDRSALQAVLNAKRLHHAWLSENGITVEPALPVQGESDDQAVSIYHRGDDCAKHHSKVVS